jgi:hypothetical protein
MELQTFIEESLKQIIAGTAQAARVAHKHGALINPPQSEWHYGEKLYFDKESGRALTTVDFDIAVTAASGTKTKGGIGVAIATVMLGSQGESAATDERISRLKFSLPIVLPSSVAGAPEAGGHINLMGAISEHEKT